MDALANEVKTFSLPLIVQNLELHNQLKEMFVSEFELVRSNDVLVHDLDTNNKLAVVSVVCLWKDSVEQTGSQTIEIEQKFPCFVAT